MYLLSGGQGLSGVRGRRQRAGNVSGHIYRDIWPGAGRRGRIAPTLGSRPATSPEHGCGAGATGTLLAATSRAGRNSPLWPTTDLSRCHARQAGAVWTVAGLTPDTRTVRAAQL